jgi:HK97 family phage major capsid protein
MSEHNAAKSKRLNELLDEIAVITTAAEAEGADEKSLTEAREKVPVLLAEGETLRKSIEQDAAILGLKGFVNDPVAGSKVYGRGPGDGAFTEPFTGPKSIGEMFVERDDYKTAVKSGKLNRGQADEIGVDVKGFLDPRLQKATFDLTSTGLDTSRIYVPRPVELIQQQRLTVRDLLSVGETSQNIIYFIKESSYTGAADMVAEAGEKPEATLATTSANVPVRKIAVVLKVTEEMYADFPQLRDYINTRLTFMVQQKEEQQLLNGAGTGNEITGILQTSGIQTQAKAADTNLDAIHKAITKIRTPTTGGYEPDGIILHPTDYQIVRLAKDSALQYYGGGPFQYAAYGNGGFQEMPAVWGLRTVVSTAITAGTALVGAFRYGGQIWQREGIRVESTNSNEDDFNFNLVSLRVEERLALAIYAPGAFCTVTGIT